MVVRCGLVVAQGTKPPGETAVSRKAVLKIVFLTLLSLACVQKRLRRHSCGSPAGTHIL